MIGQVLQDLLTEKNTNVNELSKLIDVSPQTLYSIIKRNNTKIDIEVLFKICEALNVDITVFYGEINGKKTSSSPKYESELNIEPSIDLTPKEKEYIKKYRSLNENGKIKLNGYLDDLIDNSKYIRFEPDFSQVVRTAESFSNAMQNQRTPIDNNTNK